MIRPYRHRPRFLRNQRPALRLVPPPEPVTPDYETRRRERTQGAAVTVLIVVGFAVLYAVLAYLIAKVA